MRIIAGRWGGRPIAAPPGRETRPTADRVREAGWTVHKTGNFNGTVSTTTVYYPSTMRGDALNLAKALHDDGFLMCIDVTGVDYRTASDSTTSLSFLSFVWPAERWSLAVYRHQLVDYGNSFQSDRIDLVLPAEFGQVAVFPVAGATDLEIVNYGVSFGWRFNDALSVGAGLSWYDFEIDTVSGSVLTGEYCRR